MKGRILMKNRSKASYLILMLALSITLFGCSGAITKTSDKKDTREGVWDQLSKEEQDEIVGGWESAKISKIVANGKATGFSILDKTYDGKEVYLIMFPSNRAPIVGNVEKLVDIKTNKIVGINFRN